MSENEELEKLATRVILENSMKKHGDLKKVSIQERTFVYE